MKFYYHCVILSSKIIHHRFLILKHITFIKILQLFFSLNERESFLSSYPPVYFTQFRLQKFCPVAKNVSHFDGGKAAGLFPACIISMHISRSASRPPT